MVLNQELTDSIDAVRGIMAWIRGNSIVERIVASTVTDTTVLRSIDLLIDREVPARPAPTYVDQVYETVRALLQFRTVLIDDVHPQLTEAVRRADAERAAVRMTLSAFEDNLDRLVDATADLYVAVSRWVGLPAATDQIRARFRELANPETWSAT